ncbi:MAG: cation:proton antiporter [Bacteroidales bacterium]|jgi:glutathione-regulated potassium-efflux system ancillary protein KefC|nr:cation:proton antiporter [Bacteroidales bacterium]
MDPLWLSIAFLFGFLFKQIGLAPMIGYLIAGFTLHYLGAEAGDTLDVISNYGIQLLLFTIGLKLKIKPLLRPEVWGGAGLHMILSILAIVGGVFLLSFTGLSAFENLTWKSAALIAFAMSFSSTVFAVKVLEDKGETTSLHGKTSIGILIIQDVFAVIFLAIAAGKVPNIYAIGLPVALLILRPILFYLLKHAGHGEVLVLLGLFMALILGGELFKFVGLKADLGALIMGMLIASHPKAKDMLDDLLLFKDVFLIGFFLSIGFSGFLTWNIMLISLIILSALIVKTPLWFFVLSRFKMRARTSFLSALTLSNFSEFGLIVAAVSVANNWIPKDWLIILSVVVALSFIIAAPVNTKSYTYFSRLHDFLNRFETTKRLNYDKTYDIGEAEILIFGMGRFGASAYDELQRKYGRKVLGLDYDEDKVNKNRKAGRNVIHDDATDMDFWEKIRLDSDRKDQVKVVLLCMPDIRSNLYALERLQRYKFQGLIAATGRFDDEVELLKKHGVHSAFNLYAEAGVGFADHVCRNLCSVDGEKQP